MITIVQSPILINHRSMIIFIVLRMHCPSESVGSLPLAKNALHSPTSSTMFMCVVCALHLTLCVLCVVCGVVCAGWQSWILPRQRLSNSRGASRQGKSPSLQLDLSSLTRTCESQSCTSCVVLLRISIVQLSLLQFGGGWCIVRCSCVHYYAFSEPISLFIPHKTHIHYSERLQQCRIMSMCMLRTITFTFIHY